MRNKSDLETLSMDVFYNNLKVYESDIKSKSNSSLNSLNIAFVSLDNSGNTNETINTAHSVSAACSKDQASTASYADDVMFTSFSNQSNAPQLDNEDLEQIDTDDLEEMDLKWQVAMLTMSVKRFIKKTGRKLDLNGKETVGFDLTKVECYNCHRRGHFAREYMAPRNQENRNRDAPIRNALVDTSTTNALVVQYGIGGYDSSFQAKEEVTNFALMAYTSQGSSSSDFENEAVYEEDIAFLKYDVQVKDISIKDLKNQLENALKEKEDLKLKLEKFETSSKNITKLINSQISAIDKTGLGYDSQMNESDLNDIHVNESEVVNNVVDSRESDWNDNQVNDRFKKGEGYHAVPPPYTGNYMTPRADLSFAGLENSIFKSKTISPKTVDHSLLKDLTMLTYKADSRSKDFNKVCYIHMIGNKSYLIDYQDIYGGFVAFGGNAKGGPKSSEIEVADDAGKKSTEVPRKENGVQDPAKEDKDANGNRIYTPVSADGSIYVNLGGLIPVNAATLPNADLPTDPFMPDLKDTADLQDTGIFNGAYDDEVEGVEAEFNNLELTTVVSPIPITKIHKGYPKEQIIGDPLLAPQTRRMTKTSQEHAMASMPLEQNRIDAQEVSDEFYGGAHFLLRVVVKTASTPIETNKALLKDEEAEDVDVHLYKSMIGSLMYLTVSRPDIMFAVCLWYPRHSPFDLEAFSDSDYAGASLDRKSTTGGMDIYNAIFVISSHTKKVFANMKREGKDFSGKVTPLFQSMMVQAPEDMGENAKTTQANKIASLKKRVKKLEQKRKSRTLGLKRLRKVGIARRVKSSTEASLGDQEDASRQGRMIDNINQDVEITLSVKVIKKEVSTADPVTTAGEVVTILDIEVTTAATTLQISKDGLILAQTLIEIKEAKSKAITTAAKIVTAAGTRPKEKGIVMQEPSKTPLPKPIDSSQNHHKLKTKAREKWLSLKGL
uniref:Uncharacterized protein n=1 Tax=Tanacetum cinerariifolium TaxID=118510 RepID=A0A6L2M2C4_TANCI|nr:hypothetical protein [Tanacetum cinerariifolium]